MNAAQKKKAKAIARKKRIQAEKKEAEEKKKEEAETEENGGANKKGKASAVDEDPDGKELLQKDPLEEAKQYSAILSKHCPQRFGTWTLQYDVSIRRKKYLLALQALFKMSFIDCEHSDYFSRLVDFALKMPSFGELSEAVRTVLSEEFSILLNQKSVTEYVAEAADQARQKETTALPVRVAIAQALVQTNPGSASAASKLIVDLGISSRGADAEACRVALDALKGFGAEAEESTKQWISVVKERFPLISDFS
jgi:peptide alpha-N-acetyltransferase